MKSLFMLLLVVVGLCLSVNAFAAVNNENAIENQGKYEKSEPDVRISHEYTKTKKCDKASAVVQEQCTPANKESYSTNSKDVLEPTEQKKRGCEKNKANMISGSSKTVAEEAVPGHSMDENKQ